VSGSFCIVMVANIERNFHRANHRVNIADRKQTEKTAVFLWLVTKCDIQKTAAAQAPLDDLAPTNFGVQVDYRNDQGEAARIHFHFSYSGKILHTSCRSRWRCAA